MCLSCSLSRYIEPGRSSWVSPVPRSVMVPSPSTMTTASMWLAYQNSFSVPAYSVVSCTEKPTLSRARMMRLERQFGVWMSNSVSSRSWKLRTIMGVSSGGAGSWMVPGVTAGREPLAPAPPSWVSVLEHADDGLLEDPHTGLELARADGQRRQQLDHLVVGPGGLHEEPVLEALLGDPAGHLAGGELQAAGQAAALGHEAVVLVAGDERVEARLDRHAAGDRAALQLVVGPVAADRLGRGDEGRVEAAEGAVVLARLPDVELGPHEGERHRQAVAADRLRQRDDVRHDAGLLEAEEVAGAAAAHLDVVDDEQDLVALAQVRQAAQPLRAGGVDAALALDRLDDDGGRLVEATARVGEQPLEVEEVLDIAVEVVVEGHRRGVHERDTGTAALHGVAGDRQGAEGHAVEGVGEADDGLAAGDLAGQLEGGLDGVGAAGAGEDHLVVQAARPQDLVGEGLEELVARRDRESVV